jgi:predicted unusual protein kinase regulating ubiquinone biosynthesis (AarF/ABC1/UbiB family)
VSIAALSAVHATMKLSALHLKRYREIAGLLWKYGRSDLAKQMSTEEDFGIEPPAPADPAKADAEAALPAQLADDLEAMGPTFVKLGQVLAGRPDLLPQPYLVALARLQDRVKPFPYAEVEEIVMAELGVRISKAFSRFDTEPVGSASLGQVHAAALRDGRQVVVKVQRPNIRQQIAEDFEVLAQIASFLDEHTEIGRRHRFVAILDEFRVTIQQELNYEREAHNLIALGKNLAEFKLIQVPQPVPDYFTRSVLVMDQIQGKKVTSLTPLDMQDLKGGPLAEELFKSYLKQVLVDGMFHADPHPGNVFITNDGRVALIDLGMVGHAAPSMQENLLKVLLAMSEGNGEAVADLAVQMSEKLKDFDATEFRRRISQLVALRRDQGLADMNVGRSLLEVAGIAQDDGLIVPSVLVLLAKTLMQLDEVGRILDPQFDTNASIRRNVESLMQRRLGKDFSKANAYSTLLEMKEFTTGLPSRLNRIMDAVSNSELEINVTATDAKTVMDGMQKIANRITMGIVLAGLTVGASLLMRVHTDFQLFGFPGLAILCFLGAAIGGFWLVISIFVQDYRSRREFRE